MRRVSPDMQERIARNESSFRLINEDIRRGRDADDDATRIGFVCECGQLECSRLIELTTPEYERVRSDSCQFVVIKGHEIPWVENIVDQNDRYAVIRKFDDVAELVLETDPRA
jgi:hypothetical protein